MNQKNNITSKESMLRIASWVLYDTGNSAHSITIGVVIFPIYFREVLAIGENSDLIWAIVTSISFIMSGLLSPLIGAICDIKGIRYKMFVYLSISCIISLAFFYFVVPSALILGSILFIISTSLYNTSSSIYDSFLGDISPKGKENKISGIGWAAGYIGGIFVFAICYPYINQGFENDKFEYYRITYLLAALSFSVFALPSFYYLRKIDKNIVNPVLPSTNSLIRTVLDLIKVVRQHRNLMRFFTIYFVISNGITIAQMFSAIYARKTLGFEVSEIVLITLMIQIIGIPSTIFFGWLADRINTKYSLHILLLLWIASILILFIGNQIAFIIACVIFGLSIGSTRSICRSIILNLSPENIRTEIFGLSSSIIQASSFFGLLIFGLLSGVTGSQRIAFLSAIAFFALGLLLLKRIDLKKLFANS